MRLGNYLLGIILVSLKSIHRKSVYHTSVYYWHLPLRFNLFTLSSLNENGLDKHLKDHQNFFLNFSENGYYECFHIFVIFLTADLLKSILPLFPFVVFLAYFSIWNSASAWRRRMELTVGEHVRALCIELSAWLPATTFTWAFLGNSSKSDWAS